MATPDNYSTAAQLVNEMLDRHHRRASISDGEKMMIDPGQVLDNITEAMRRLDLDIDTPVSIEADVVPLAELQTLIQQLHMAPTLISHVVNTAMEILTARYPTQLVTTPLQPEFDLREMHPLQMGDRPHAVAKDLFNRRLTAEADLEFDEVEAAVAECDAADQIHTFVAAFYMYGVRLGALKYTTGIA